MERDSVKQIFVVTLALSVVCSLIISVAAVQLRPRQKANRINELRKNVLVAAGRYEKGSDLAAAFAKIETRLVDLETGTYTESQDPATYDQRSAPREPSQSIAIPTDRDYAGIGRREKLSLVYLARNDEGTLEQVILPFYGKGLFSTLYGFLSIDATDFETVRGLTYYEHGETPGLGGEVDQPKWKALWAGKKLYNEKGEVAVHLVKAAAMAPPDDPAANYEVDALSGATLTSNGVTDMIRYWFGPDGFQPFLDNLKATKGGDSDG
jgi:Na+-transporting NADH:ubiquinone oxidoreductase subunit C